MAVEDCREFAARLFAEHCIACKKEHSVNRGAKYQGTIEDSYKFQAVGPFGRDVQWIFFALLYEDRKCWAGYALSNPGKEKTRELYLREGGGCLQGCIMVITFGPRYNPNDDPRLQRLKGCFVDLTQRAKDSGSSDEMSKKSLFILKSCHFWCCVVNPDTMMIQDQDGKPKVKLADHEVREELLYLLSKSRHS